MDEPTAVLKARSFLAKLDQGPPVNVSAYAQAIGAEIFFDKNLPDNTGGFTTTIGLKHVIVVNDNDSLERKRFTICHEIGHLVLGLPTAHDGSFRVESYAKRAPSEILCDVFASELLLPWRHFGPRLQDLEITFESITSLADEFEVSLTCTGSRFAANNRSLCAFVISNGGQVRYPAISTPLREFKAFIKIGWTFPADSPSALARAGKKLNGPSEVAADLWFQDWKRGGILLEEARHYPRWDQTLTLLWLDEDSHDGNHRVFPDSDDELGLEELDGVLRFQKKSKRR